MEPATPKRIVNKAFMLDIYSGASMINL